MSNPIFLDPNPAFMQDVYGNGELSPVAVEGFTLGRLPSLGDEI
ncbi:hypothetical protein [Oculatella sp. LEGE 06141]|nr:hypothetical protein [Oculatella sp. LEGE 06141]